MKPLSEQTREIYEREAGAYDRHRGRDLFERAWLERALADVPESGAVLDLGCGAGEPIAGYLVERGFAVTGADFAQPMLDIFARRFPRATAIRADMRHLDLGTRFGAIIGWGSFFHLTMAEQRSALPRIARHLAPGGKLLLTVGPDEGEVTGLVGASTVYHASLSRNEYASILLNAEVVVEDFVPEDPQCKGFTLLLARRSLC